MIRALQHYRNRHQGKLAFLIGNGPSAGDVDPELLKPYVTMAINESVFKFEHTTYFFSTDDAVFLSGLLEHVLDLKDGPQVIFRKDSDVADIECVPARKGIGDATTPLSSARSDEDGLVVTSSSAHAAAHLLHVMGCDPIVLIGCDCKMDSQYAFWMEPQYYAKAPAWYRETFGERPAEVYDGVYQTKFDSAPLWAMLSTHRAWWSFLSHLPLLSASGGHLDCLPQMNLDRVLETYGDRRL